MKNGRRGREGGNAVLKCIKQKYSTMYCVRSFYLFIYLRTFGVTCKFYILRYI